MSKPSIVDRLRSQNTLEQTMAVDEAADLIERLTRVELWAKRVCRHKGYGGYDLQAAYGGLEKALLPLEETVPAIIVPLSEEEKFAGRLPEDEGFAGLPYKDQPK